MKQTTISIDRETKQKAEKAAKNINLSLAGVTRILLNDFAEGRLTIGTIQTAPSMDGYTIKERKELAQILRDLQSGQNIEGPFTNAEDFISSMK